MLLLRHRFSPTTKFFLSPPLTPSRSFSHPPPRRTFATPSSLLSTPLSITSYCLHLLSIWKLSRRIFQHPSRIISPSSHQPNFYSSENFKINCLLIVESNRITFRSYIIITTYNIQHLDVPAPPPILLQCLI